MNWPRQIRRASREFGIAPEAFWRLSLKEWRALTGQPTGLAPISRADLEALIDAYPDTPTKERET